jgi:hypothetical protein
VRYTGPFVLITCGLFAAACGYRPTPRSLPGGGEEVRVVLPNPGAVHEPELPRMLATELCRQLSRAGIRASTAGGGATLTTRLLSLWGLPPVVGPRPVVVAVPLRLQLELRLSDPSGATLWRSGLLEVEHTWPLSPGSPLTSEAARARALSELATEAARRATLLLLHGS